MLYSKESDLPQPHMEPKSLTENLSLQNIPLKFVYDLYSQRNGDRKLNESDLHMKKITFEIFQVNFGDGFDWLPVFNSNYLDLKGKYGIGKYKSIYSIRVQLKSNVDF